MILVAGLAATSRAAAEDVPKPSPALAPSSTASVPFTVSVGYGWQTLAFDGAALAFALAYGAAEPTSIPFDYMAGGAYFLGAPTVHVVHQHLDKALASVALRAASPLVFAFLTGGIAAAAQPDDGDSLEHSLEVQSAVAVGSAIGAIAASVIDATLIAREPVPVTPPSTVGKVTTLAPTVSVVPQGAMIGVRGAIF